VAQGASGTTSITTAVTSGSGQNVTLSVTGLPSGTSASFSPSNVIAAGSSATLTLSATSSAAPGSYPVTLRGQGTSATHTVELTLVVQSSDFSLSVTPASYTLAQGGTATGSVATAGTAQTISLSASGLPSGVSASFAPSSVSAGSSATLTLFATASAAAGSYHVTVTGTGASATRTVTVALTVTTTGGGGGVTNGNFETGSLSGWSIAAGSASTTSSAHAGSFAAIVGSTSPSIGDSAIVQTFDVPAAGGTLSFWYNVHCPDTVTYDWATASLRDNTTGTTTTVLPKTCPTSATWTKVSASLVAGHNVTLTLTSHDDNYVGDATYTWFDDVTISAPVASSIVNPGFEEGTLNGWTSGGKTGMSTSYRHSGTYAGMVGSTSPTAGDSSLSQTFTVPAGATKLTFWYRVVCPDSVIYDWATATLKNVDTGATSTILAKTCSNNGTWQQVTATVTAGSRVTLTLVSHDDDYVGDATVTYFDDVALQ
jgi:hypothetical protein